MTDEAPIEFRDSTGDIRRAKTINYPLAPHNLIDITEGDCAWLKLNPENIEASQRAAMREFAKFDWRDKPRATGVKVIDRNLEVFINECMTLGDAFSRITSQAMKMRKGGVNVKTETLDVVFEGREIEPSLAEAVVSYVFNADLNDAEAMKKADFFARNLATQQFKSAVARHLAKCNPL